ncbi:ABC transporter permease [Aliirhizobium smilacinae]|uniref:ABC transporter permease n=1 Tax=Aliirhizobium smilacinae TaxID=1395944 RepID=A0A5C4XHU6_9HYPH|nr:ABC transporter permease [Rhizobium smilacinae]TNM63056.1 ABC transporter permease [Rhizobium smilacinae]
MSVASRTGQPAASGFMSQGRQFVGLAILLAFLSVFFLYPLVEILVLSVIDAEGSLSLQPLYKLLTNAGIQSILLQTAVTSVTVAFTCLVIAYPAAACLARLEGWKATLGNIIILFPFLTSSLVRTFVFIVLLGRNGMLNQFLVSIGVPGAPWKLLFNQTGVIIGMTYVLLPYMLLSLVGSMKRVDARLIDAARSLGAGRVTIFFTVYLPLTAPGVAAGLVITTILAFGYFVTPALMGGPAQVMIAQLVEQQVVIMFNLSQAAGLSIIMLVIVGVAYAVAARWLGIARLMRAG